ncbi:MAG: hypothetical protein QM784_40390 [Polyangiaceae bacterium]
MPFDDGKSESLVETVQHSQATSVAMSSPPRRPVEPSAAPPKRSGERAAFIRSLPEDTPYKEVIKRAAEHGLKISKNHIFSQRTADKESRSKAAALATEIGATSSNKPIPRLDPLDLEAQLRNAVAQLGLRRAYEILGTIESQIREFKEPPEQHQ